MNVNCNPPAPGDGDQVLGDALRARERGELLVAYRLASQAAEIEGPNAEALKLAGELAIRLKDPKRAAGLLRRATEISPSDASAWNLLGLAWIGLCDARAAMGFFQKALEIRSHSAEIRLNLARALYDLGHFKFSCIECDRVIATEPDSAAAYLVLAGSLQPLGEMDAALAAYDRARELDPELAYALGDRLATGMHVCSWEGLSDLQSRMEAGVAEGRKVVQPFITLMRTASPPLQKKAADIWYYDHHWPVDPLPRLAPRRAAGRIRLGYFGADFHTHALMHLMAELFEVHDRKRFELFAYSSGPGSRDPMRQRLKSAFDSFHDVRALCDRDVALMARSHGIDIALDLSGYSNRYRADVFSLRAAPVQVNFESYTGTLGGHHMDYIVGDETVIPREEFAHYSEKVVHLPHTYLVNDGTRSISGKYSSRADLGLREADFVFACFNGNHKISPAVFDCWLRLLARVDRSVLWLYRGTADAEARLRSVARARGISADRLVFAKHAPLPDHLSRIRNADLVLDTWPYNSHTTASDALWAGVPLVTRLGSTFAGRVAASLLKALHVPELIAEDEDSYERLAGDLAIDRERLRLVRARIAHNRSTAPAFDTRAYARHLERAYEFMFERSRAGLPPAHFRIAQDGSAQELRGS